MMSKPLIYFCGSEDRYNEIRSLCKEKMESVFVTEQNADSLLVSPKSNASLICILFDEDITGDSGLLRKIYKYSDNTACPVCIEGSENSYNTAVKHTSAIVQSATAEEMAEAINRMHEFLSNNPNGRFEMYKARFLNVIAISNNMPFLALCDDRIAASKAASRMIILTGDCNDEELENIEGYPLSGIIINAPSNYNIRRLIRNAPEANISVLIVGYEKEYNEFSNSPYVDIVREDDELYKILNTYNRKRVKRSRNHS